MTAWNPVYLTRQCSATTVPYGERVTLDAGGLVEVVQRLGSSITVRTQMGALLRIAGTDADAVGLEPLDITSGGAEGQFDLSQVTGALQQIYDPEIPVGIVELDSLYRCEETRSAGGGRRIEIDMTMTAPGAAAWATVLRDDAARGSWGDPRRRRRGDPDRLRPAVARRAHVRNSTSPDLGLM